MSIGHVSPGCGAHRLLAPLSVISSSKRQLCTYVYVVCWVFRFMSCIYRPWLVKLSYHAVPCALNLGCCWWLYPAGEAGGRGGTLGVEAAVFETWMTIWIGAIDYYFYYCHVVLCQEGINTWISRKWWQELPLPLQLPPSSQRPPLFPWSIIMDHMETPNIRVEELQTCHDSCGLPVDLPSKVQQGDTFVRGQYVVQIVSNETELELRLKINQLSTPCTDQVTPTRT